MQRRMQQLVDAARGTMVDMLAQQTPGPDDDDDARRVDSGCLDARMIRAR